MKKVTPTSWLLVSLVGFVLFILVFAGIIVYSKQITISTPVYFFLVVILALISTAFLAGAMRSVARYSGTFQNRNLYIAGPALIFMIILYIAYKYRPENAAGGPLSLSVLFVGPKGDAAAVSSGTVYVRIGQYAGTDEISKRGTATFTGINADYKGQPIDISGVIEGFQLDTAGAAYRLSDTHEYTNLTVRLKRLGGPRTVVRGKVMLPERKGIPAARIIFQGVDSVFTTDSLGNFSAVLPLKPGSETRVIVTKGALEIYNSLRTVSDNDYLSIVAN
jgi:hypothetical protein